MTCSRLLVAVAALPMLLAAGCGKPAAPAGTTGAARPAPPANPSAPAGEAPATAAGQRTPPQAPASTPAAAPPATSSAPSPAPTAALAASPSAPASQPPTTQETELVYILMTTNKGDILLELDPVKAPVSVSNFLSYVQEGFYRDTIFHRVMANFMIQGGGFTVEFQRKPTSAAIVNEWKNGLKNARGTIAMARTNAPDSATSQFFINLKDNTNLDAPISGGAAYAVFGRVVAGMDVVDAIAAVPVKPGRLNPAERSEPVDPVLITQVVRLSAQEARQRQETAGRT